MHGGRDGDDDRIRAAPADLAVDPEPHESMPDDRGGAIEILRRQLVPCRRNGLQPEGIAQLRLVVIAAGSCERDGGTHRGENRATHPANCRS
jgi:hypothetical protein